MIMKYKKIVAVNIGPVGTLSKDYKSIDEAHSDKHFLYDRLYGVLPDGTKERIE